MFNFFDLDTIPTFLMRFKVEKVLIIGLSNEQITNKIISYCIDNDYLLYAIDPDINIKNIIKLNFNKKNIDKYITENVKYFKEESLKVLNSLKSFDAIFINDDPNWYTIYNELNLIKKNNPDFPLTFICNNKYPHKRRDSYLNPNNIPTKYKNKCCNGLPIEYIENNEIKKTLIKDGFCHAVNKNTPKNGVLTAIEDFVNENDSLNVLEINPLEGITLIYAHSSISYIRINQIHEEEIESNYTPGDLSDKIIENNIILKYINNLNLNNEDLNKIHELQSQIKEKNIKIEDYKNEIELHNSKLKYKDLQITNANRQASLKNSEIKNIETKLINKNHDIQIKETELKSIQNKLKDLENNYINNKKELENTKQQLLKANNDTKNKELIENKYKELIQIKEDQFKQKETELKSIQNKLKDLENNYINNKKELENTKQQLLKANNDTKNKELIENKYKELIQIKEIQLDQKETESKNVLILKSEYLKQFSKLNTKEYCISCYKEEIHNNNLEIEYLKKNNKLIKKLINPLAYALILGKSKPKEIMTNIKLYKALKNSDYFDIGYYLNKNPDLLKSKWCKYFSPELHYICNGFDEKREFNKKYYNTNDKKELIKNITNKY